MYRKLTFVILITVHLFQTAAAQHENHLKEINMVWEKFCQSFDSLDHDLFASIHAEDLIRIPNGKRVIDFEKYMERQKKNFEKLNLLLQDLK